LTNDQYLIVSYFVCAALSVAAGLLVYLYLRRPFAGVADAASGKHLPTLLKRLLPCGLVFPALLGFLSVSYQGCDKSYADIVQNREYLVAKNHEQISAILFYIVVAILFWNLIALLILRSARPELEKKL
jgi:uncharacterized iron-regulated membrane protein